MKNFSQSNLNNWILLVCIFLISIKPLGAQDAPAPPIVAAAVTPAIIPGPYCEGGLSAKKKPNGDSIYMENEVLFPGSSGLSQCEKLSFGHMKNLYKNGRRTSLLETWKDMLDYACKESCSNVEEYNNCIKKKVNTAKTCESVAYLMSVFSREWENPEHNQSDKGTVSTTTGIKCQSLGVETLDYEPCLKFAKNIDTIEVVQQAGYGAQQLIYQDKMIDTQTKYMNEQNAATGALKGQKDSIEMQKQMYQQRTAVDAAKLALLFSAYQGMPKLQDLTAKCNVMPQIEIMPGHLLTQEDCRNAVRSGQANFALLLNQKETEKMKVKMITIATQAGNNAMLASLLGKRSKDIDNAIAKIDSFKPINPLLPEGEDLTSTFCQQNPGLPQCLIAGLEKTYDPLADNVITFGEGGLGTTYGNQTPESNLSANSITESTESHDGVGPMGSAVQDADNTNTMEKSSAATVTSGPTGSSGGAGGGLGGGGAGGGGGGSAPSAGGTPGGTQAATQGKTPRYEGGAGSLSMMGGFGIKNKKAGEKEENPFGKLFGKDGAKGSGVINFRELASQKVGNKDDNIFDMISKRYTSVAGDKRLIEYELTK